MVLLDDNFRTVISAIGEGRQLFHNLRRSFAFLLMIRLPLVSTAALIPFLGYPLLYPPVHIVWLELLIHPVAILGFQQAADGGLIRSVDHNHGPFFTIKDWLVILTTGSAIAAAVLGIYVCSFSAGEAAVHARSMALVSLISSLALLLPVIARSLAASVVALSSAALVSTLVVTKIDNVAALFHLHPLSWQDFFLAFGIGAVPALGAWFFRPRFA